MKAGTANRGRDLVDVGLQQEGTSVEELDDRVRRVLGEGLGPSRSEDLVGPAPDDQHGYTRVAKPGLNGCVSVSCDTRPRTHADPRVSGHVAGAEVLAITPEVRPGQSVFVEDLQESDRTATVLDVGQPDSLTVAR